MICPYCGKEMEKGKIQTNGSTMLFSVNDYAFLKVARAKDVQLAKGYNSNVEAYNCPECKKIVIEY